MKNLLKKIMITGIVALSLGSCSEEFLDTVTIGAQSEDSFYASDADLIQASTAIYAPLWQYHYNWGRTTFNNQTTDDAVDRELLQYQDYTFDSGHFLFRYNWRYNYRGILIANKLLENVEGVDKPLVSDKQLQKRVVAEAKFLRAWYYYDLVKNYGAVPLTTEPLLQDDMNLERTPAIEVYAQIEKDLLEAKEDLPLKSELDASDRGRVTKGAALALLVKVNVTQASPGYVGQDFHNASKYGDAKIYAEQFFQLGYSLYQGNYNDIFTIEGEDGSGSIFEIQYYISPTANEHPKSGNGNFNTFLMMPWYGGGDPYGKYMVTYDLYSAFEDGDPRREASLYNVYEQADAWDGPGGIEGPDVKADHASFVNRKHWMDQSTYSGLVRNSPINERMMRLSDIYLLYAEACLNTGDDANALEYVNQIRSRARGAGIVPANLNAVTLEDVYQERRVELCNEGQRRHDLVRLGILEKELSVDGYIAKAVVTPDGKDDFDIVPGEVFRASALVPSTHMYFPIPLGEIDNTNGVVVQNPGY